MSANFGIHRDDIIKDRLTLSQIVAMWDAIKETSG